VVIGPAPAGSACMRCFSTEGEVLKTGMIGAKPETLHRHCANDYFETR
jgi:hypothetical protein